MSLIYCKECGKKISNKADKCIHCGAPLSNEPKDINNNSNKKNYSGLMVLKVIGIIILFFIIFSLLDDGSTSSDTKSSEISKENYDLIKIGMTKEQVFSILGSNATISVVDMKGLGKMELYHYQRPLSTKAIMIYFVNDVVDSKNWVEL